MNTFHEEHEWNDHLQQRLLPECPGRGLSKPRAQVSCREPWTPTCFSSLTEQNREWSWLFTHKALSGTIHSLRINHFKDLGDPWYYRRNLQKQQDGKTSVSLLPPTVPSLDHTQSSSPLPPTFHAMPRFFTYRHSWVHVLPHTCFRAILQWPLWLIHCRHYSQINFLRQRKKKEKNPQRSFHLKFSLGLFYHCCYRKYQK